MTAEDPREALYTLLPPALPSCGSHSQGDIGKNSGTLPVCQGVTGLCRVLHRSARLPWPG